MPLITGKNAKIERAEHKATKAFFASVMNSCKEVKSCFLPDGTIVYSNDAVKCSLGYSLKEYKAKRIFEIVHPHDVSSMIKVVKKIVSIPGESLSLQLRMLHKNGTWRWVEGCVTNLLADKNVNGLLYSYTDVTEQRELIKRLESFNYTVSHDLQSPLCAVSNFSRMLVDSYGDKLGDSGKKYLDIIDNNTRQMIQLVRDLLEFSKLGEQAILPQITDMNEIVEVIRDEVKTNYRDIKTDIRLHKLKPAYCDPRLIKLVWRNLISNAVKYSSKRSAPVVEIGMKKTKVDDVYFVKDNGAGFNMQYAGKLFEIFQRMHSDDEYEGTGLGLATSHRIITKHGGRIWASATENRGADFYFTVNS